MRIAQVAPLHESVPPQAYGGTERVVSYLTEELVRQGHDVTLFASADSVTRARLVPCAPRALRTDPDCHDPLAHHLRMFEQVARLEHRFDIIHFHTDYLHFPLARRTRVPTLTTFHGRLDIPDLRPLALEYAELPLSSISLDQRAPLPHANWVGAVHHGLPLDLYRLQPEPGRYLVFLGRISPEKRPDRAIALASEAGIPLKIAAKVDRKDRDYYEANIRPLLDNPLVEWLGEIGDDRKQELLGHALALIFLIDWPEPFGLVMIEAMACGTPVIACPRGSVPEIIRDGVNGFLVDDVRHAAEVVRGLRAFDRRRCREDFQERFSAPRMAADYVDIYRRLVGAARRTRPDAEPAGRATVPGRRAAIPAPPQPALEETDAA